MLHGSPLKTSAAQSDKLELIMKNAKKDSDIGCLPQSLGLGWFNSSLVSNKALLFDKQLKPSMQPEEPNPDNSDTSSSSDDFDYGRVVGQGAYDLSLNYVQLHDDHDTSFVVGTGSDDGDTCHPTVYSNWSAVAKNIQQPFGDMLVHIDGAISFYFCI